MLLLQKPRALKYSDSPVPQLSPQPDLQVTLQDFPTPCCKAEREGEAVSPVTQVSRVQAFVCRLPSLRCLDSHPTQVSGCQFSYTEAPTPHSGLWMPVLMYRGPDTPLRFLGASSQGASSHVQGPDMKCLSGQRTRPSSSGNSSNSSFQGQRTAASALCTHQKRPGQAS